MSICVQRVENSKNYHWALLKYFLLVSSGELLTDVFTTFPCPLVMDGTDVFSVSSLWDVRPIN